MAGPPLSSGSRFPTLKARPIREPRCHSQFLWIVPLGGILAPILIWQLKKGDLPGLDEHGRILVNWLLSALIYAAICAPLILVLVGIPLLIALGILGIIFPIVGAVQAGKGAAWKYPMSIVFFK